MLTSSARLQLGCSCASPPHLAISPANHSTDWLAEQFTQYYYSCFDSDRALLAPLYVRPLEMEGSPAEC